MGRVAQQRQKGLQAVKALIGKSLWFLLLGLSAAAYYLLAYHTDRSSFDQLIALVAILFGAYAIITASQFRIASWMLVAALAFRVLWIGALPELSDDYFRFLWDGRLWANGINPFSALPSSILALSELPQGITPELYNQLNSPEYFSVYPPIGQFTFGLAAILFPENDLAAVIILRVILILGDLFAFYSLRKILDHFRKPRDLAYIYLLCPLTIIEFTGNLHYEGLMMAFVLNAFYQILKRRWLSSAVLFGIAVSTKLIPLLFLPFLFRFAGWRIALTYYAVVALVLAILFSPFFSVELITHFSESLDLYFRRFEFNASLYYLVREIGYRISGFNKIALIGPLMSAGTFLIIMIWALAGRSALREKAMPALWMGAHTVFLLLATTVHPWYIGVSLALMPLTRLRFPALWAALAYLSYATYRTTSYQEDLLLVAIEYGVLLVFIIWEVSQSTTKRGISEGRRVSNS